MHRLHMHSATACTVPAATTSADTTARYICISAKGQGLYRLNKESLICTTKRGMLAYRNMGKDAV